LRHHVGCCNRFFGPGGQRPWKWHQLIVPRIHCDNQHIRLRIHGLWRTRILYSQPDFDLCDHPDQLYPHHHPYAHTRCPHDHQDHWNFYCSGPHIYDLHFRVYVEQYSVSWSRVMLCEFLRLCQHNRLAVMACPKEKNTFTPQRME